MSSINFVCFGDWGSGTSDQVKVARSLATYYRDAPFGFICGLGDNFYPRGVSANNYRRLMIDRFTEVYQGLPVPFHMILGNHDHLGDPLLQRRLGALDPRWKMPSSYYDFIKTTGEGLRLHFITLDSDRLQRKTKESDKQVAWMHRRLRRYRNLAHWTILMTHHPLVSSGCHGDATPYYKGILEEAIEQYPIDLILSGHDHDKQVTRLRSGATQVISGSAGYVRYCRRSEAQTRASNFVAETLGFCAISATKYILDLRFYVPEMSANPSGNGKYQQEYSYLTEPRSTFIQASPPKIPSPNKSV